jgi:hypothetical protein
VRAVFFLNAAQDLVQAKETRSHAVSVPKADRRKCLLEDSLVGDGRERTNKNGMATERAELLYGDWW